MHAPPAQLLTLETTEVHASLHVGAGTSHVKRQLPPSSLASLAVSCAAPESTPLEPSVFPLAEHATQDIVVMASAADARRCMHGV